MSTFYEFTVTGIDGSTVRMDQFRGRTVLVVNTATQCHMARQLRGLERLWRDYAQQGLVVLGFPCNQFLRQEPGTEEQIDRVCQERHGITFPLTAKIDVNGPFAHPLWQWVEQEKPGWAGPAVRWNYTKFLISREGRVLARFAPTTTPERLRHSVSSALWV